MRIKFTPINRFTILVALCLITVQYAFAQKADAPSAKQIAAKVDEYMNAAVKIEGFSGSILVARDGQPIISKGYGMASIELNVPNTPQTVFRLASITKQFTAMAIMMLQERGKLNVGDSVCKHLADCPAIWQPITIHHLLTHTSGIQNYTDFPDFWQKNTLPTIPAEMVAWLKDKPLDFVQGEKYKYSNSGYNLLGLIIERASGKSYAEFLQENIFTPLGMKQTGYYDLRRIIKNRAAGYQRQGKSVVNARYNDMSWTFASGALYSTTEDLLLWDKALYTEKLLSTKSRDEMFTPFKFTMPGVGYAYGWVVDKKAARFDRQVMGHGGEWSGVRTFILRFTADRVTIILLSNNSNVNPTRIAFDLAAVVFGKSYQLPKPPISDVLLETITQKGIDFAIQQYRELKRTQAANYNFSEPLLNTLGFELIREQKLKEAIEIFKLNVEMFPQSANAYDSLGEAYMVNGDKELAIKNYERSLELDPQNKGAVDMLKKLRGNN